MNKELANKILEFIRKNELLAEGDRVLLGLSGGPDSVFAFHFLIEYGRKLGVEFSSLHLNHSLRGSESDKDEKFCKKICNINGVRLFHYKSDILKISGNSKRSVEETARAERYMYFEQCAKQNNFNKIITAHNMDDNTETIFLNLIKGAGISSLAGIPVKRSNIVRPFLCLSKSEILDFLHQNRIEYREDSSNFDSIYERNYLRNEILPRIKNKINPKLNESVFHTAGIVANFYNLVETEIDHLFNKFVIAKSNSVKIDLDLFGENEFAIGEVLKKVFKEYLKIEFNQVNYKMLIDLKDNQVGKRNHLRDKWHAVRERDSIEIYIPDETKTEEIRFNLNESVEFENTLLKIENTETGEYSENGNKNVEFISADNLDDIFILRKWNSGDVFTPLGMKGQKKVSDFLTDLKISNKLRRDVYVLLNRNKIVWVVGLRIDENFKVSNTTKRTLKLCLKQKKN